MHSDCSSSPIVACVYGYVFFFYVYVCMYVCVWMMTLFSMSMNTYGSAIITLDRTHTHTTHFPSR